MDSQPHVFISSKMQELAPERRALQELLPTLGHDLVKLRAWIFEGDAPASDKPIREVYLEALRSSVLYIGLFWHDYGEWTLDEFERASEWGIDRHIYVKNVEPERRDSRLQDFLDKQGDVRFGITARWFTDLDDLRDQVSKSVEKWLLDRQIAHHSATSAILAHIVDDVPDLPRRLIGREDLIDEVQALLNDGQRVVLQGLGGIGKSALAATIAAQFIDHGPVIWIKAGDADASALFEALVRLFDAQGQMAGKTGDELIQALRHILAGTKALLVLDDAWNGSALAELMRAVPRRMSVLVTSRQRFPLDEIIEVGELSPDEALELLGHHVRRRDFKSDPDAARLCELLGYHAFALEIASKTLKVYNLTPAALLQRIEDSPHDLTMPANFGELGRSGIKSLLDTSVNALDKDLYDTFITFGGMFEPSSTAELLARTMGLEEALVLDRLEQLTLRGLANPRAYKGLSYYRLHDLAYSYARTMFLNKGLKYDPAIIACRDYAAHHKDDLDALDIEQSNLLEAAEAANQLDRPILVEIMRLLTVDGPYFAARGHTTLSLRLMEQAITTARDMQQIETAHYLLSRLGNTYVDFLGDYPRALKTYQEALNLARILENRQREAILLTVIAKVRFLQKQADSDDYYEQAEAIARTLDDPFALSFVLHHRGYQWLNRPDPDYRRCYELSHEAARIASQHELHEIYFHSLINQGAAEFEMGQVADALVTHQMAYGLAQKQGNQPWMASALQSMGEDYDHLQAYDQAQSSLNKALELWRQSGGEAQAATLTKFMKEKNYPVQLEQGE
ncbi:MAG: tetratricopeptide repeat protein [Anaerolineae bacterium]|nr:tetratricopeptide repeat protein [Anaerolineae bacterium]